MKSYLCQGDRLEYDGAEYTFLEHSFGALVGGVAYNIKITSFLALYYPVFVFSGTPLSHVATVQEAMSKVKADWRQRTTEVIILMSRV